MVDIKLTETGKKFMADNYPPGILYEYDPEGVFGLHAVAAEFVELTDHTGWPYRLPHEVDGRSTWGKADG